MLITTQNEIMSLMPTTRWDRPSQLLGYLEEEERVALEPLLGGTLYEYLCEEYVRLRAAYTDITATTVRPTGRAAEDARLAYADVTERLEQIQAGRYRETYTAPTGGDKEVPPADMAAIRLIRICQRIEFYKMLSHKAGLLAVSFNEGGGMNRVSADGYEPAGDKDIDRMAKDAFMSAGRAVDDLLLYLEGDAKGARLFTAKWQDADAFWLHRDLLFQTARVLNEYLPIKGDRMAYVDLVRDIRFCQNTYLRPRIGAKLLKAVVDYANAGLPDAASSGSGSGSGTEVPGGEAYDVLLDLLRTALAFYVEGRRTELGPRGDRLARRDSMTDAQQAMATACQYVGENLDALGDAATGTPVYNAVREREKAEQDAAATARRRMCREHADGSRRKLFSGFPATHRTPELK